jgi:hypothetical protein
VVEQLVVLLTSLGRNSRLGDVVHHLPTKWDRKIPTRGWPSMCHINSQSERFHTTPLIKPHNCGLWGQTAHLLNPWSHQGVQGLSSTYLLLLVDDTRKDLASLRDGPT